jgi:general L-amino acid transport system permease protein
MAVYTKPFQDLFTRDTAERINWRDIIQVHFTSSWWMMLWLAALAYLTVTFVGNRLAASPVVTIIVLVIWAVTLVYALASDVTRNYSSSSLWLKNGLYNSVTNIFLTLVLSLIIVATVQSVLQYTIFDASFSTDPVTAAEQSNGGAEWGAVIDNLTLFNVFRFSDKTSGLDFPISWRLWTLLGILGAMTVASLFVYRESFKGNPLIRRILTWMWTLSPVLAYLLLRGAPALGLPLINPDIIWGGLLLTMILSIFAIVISFPIGILLALGRRSDIKGIPAWLTYGVALIIMVGGLILSTPTMSANARNTIETILAYWPLIVPVIAFMFQRSFNGNVVAATSVVFIETVRGVPFITVLFLATVIIPLIFPKDWQILNTWRVMIGFAMFSAAYLAENVRGGLQAIPRGQYEAADSIGLSNYQKYRLIIMPQALRIVIPAMVGLFIGLFKDTTLVIVVGMFDLLGVANSISSQMNWLGHRTEPYIYIFVIYFIGSALMTWYSRRLEKQQSFGER